jgi:hypothetical protein
MPRPWLLRAVDALCYFRSCGWRCAFILCRNRLHPIGIASPRQLARLAGNDDRRS